MISQTKTVWTIGHSTHSFNEFVTILHAWDIKRVADIRRFPGSRKFPQFNKDTLQENLLREHIQYMHLPELGGRRKPGKDSTNTVWRHPAFRGYADYMETDSFKSGIAILEHETLRQRTAYMCSEALWWRCHRSMVSDYLKAKGWTVWHIMGETKVEEHPYTSPAHIVNGELRYGKQKNESDK